ncbi:DUF1232 domain-containing protein [Bacillus sp. ISL-35]|uniref:YkvA family protein n=1 Tax=Bacillus sp. ISL-35 TaxID=2819122 RepID=UPI001BEA15A8|nr:DUF1232 domain-containing protein [Bacillus sp. ISL-35]MBT2681031.1 DUF1232 domain-containing protein [Bacillus sp. ISL-35]MBT2705350.1 DUF1232 domain-containing protein [Chryseobacterium sp. ISL-80]
MKKFFKRIRLVFKVKKFVPFLIEFFTTGSVPVKQKIISAGLIIGYFLLPFDIIPDFLTLIGIVDDVGVLLIVFQQIIKMAPAELREKHKLE